MSPENARLVTDYAHGDELAVYTAVRQSPATGLTDGDRFSHLLGGFLRQSKVEDKDEIWRPRPENLRLPVGGAVDIWRISLSSQRDQAWRRVLTTDELVRASRFRFRADRDRFTITRGILRTLLGEYVGMAPQGLHFSFNSWGKPRLCTAENREQIEFNVSHSGNYSLMVFGIAIDVGIDIEFLSRQRCIMELADLVLSPSEKLCFRNIPQEAREKTMLRIWTRKEALIKALGAGLSIPPSGLEDMLFAVEHRAFNAREESMIRSSFSVRDLSVSDQYVAAVAANSQNIRMRLWNWRSRALSHPLERS